MLAVTLFLPTKAFSLSLRNLAVVKLVFFLLIAFIVQSLAYDTADVHFEIEVIGINQLSIKAYDKTRTFFEHIVDSNFSMVGDEECNLERGINNQYSLRYQAKDQVRLVFQIDQQGNILLLQSHHTNYQQRKSWGFKTSGKIVIEGSCSFFQLFTQSQEFYNENTLKFYSAEIMQNYFFNRGIIHIGDADPYGGIEAYLQYLPFIDQEAEPYYQKDVFDNYGVFINGKM